MTTDAERRGRDLMGQPLTLDEVGVADEDAAQVIYDLRRELAEANGVLRSVHAIAERYEDDGKTNWSGFKRRLDEVLERQRSLMYPGTKVVTEPWQPAV